jgi:DNA recombination protein RmuC
MIDVLVLVLSLVSLLALIFAGAITRLYLKSRDELMFWKSRASEDDALSQRLDGIAAQALKGNTEAFFSLAKSDSDKQQLRLENLLQPLQMTLSSYQNHLESLEKERQKSYSSVESELRKVVEVSAKLNAETTALKNALKKPHVRGRWGEVQLKNCIDLAGMSEFCDVSFQDTTTDDAGRIHRPDMTVRMPGGRVVLVDAKTPLDAFLAALESTDDAHRSAEMARHGRQVKDHIKRLSTRAYTEAVAETADFTVLFLPNESFLYAALESEPDLVEFALQKKILVATPPTLVGLLKVIRFGWNEERLAENAAKISEAGQELHKRLVDFVESFVAVGKHLDKATEQYETSRARLQSRVLVQAERMEALGAKSHKELPIGGLPSNDLVLDAPAGSRRSPSI